MKSKMTVLLMVAAISIFLLFFPGCYTQLGSLRDEQVSEKTDYTTADSEPGSSDVSSYDRQSNDYYNYNNYDNSYPQYRVGFSYYYPASYWPSSAFTVAYNNPWYYDSYWAYDPWWCGTPYVTYPGYGYSNYYYNNYYWGSYLPPAYYRYGYSYASVPIRRTAREFGSTRGGSTRNGTTNTDVINGGIDRGSSYTPASGGFAPAPASGGVSAGRSNSQEVPRSARPRTSQRGYSSGADNAKSTGRTDRGVRGASSRGGRSRGDSSSGSRSQSPQYNPNPGYSSPPASYTPPVRNSQPSREASPARESAPRQSGGSTRPPENSSRGGSSRGRP